MGETSDWESCVYLTLYYALNITILFTPQVKTMWYVLLFLVYSGENWGPAK